ncbi:MAG: RimK family alpha-L-glutamate ligase [Actinomycetota bacterium]
MKLGILSRAPRSYSTQRLRAAGFDRGIDIAVFDTLRFAIDLSREDPNVTYRGRDIDDIDAILPRIGASITFYGLSVVRQFQAMDVYTPNTADGIANSRDKLRAMQILSRHEIQVPATTFVRERSDIRPAIDRVGGAPVVIKTLEGTQGIGVILAPDLRVAEAVIETLQSTNQNVLIQRFVAESRGRDVRALVVGDRVVASMRRIARGDEFRSNVHRGGRTEAVTLDAEMRDVALRAAQTMGLTVAGVDMLESDDGPLVMEVNSTPGLQGIEEATGLDVAGSIIDHIVTNVNLPDLDVRQRLSEASGYGVAEIPVDRGTDIDGVTLGQSGLRERDITVLVIENDFGVVPNPSSDRLLSAGDRLLCFGRLDEMRALVPARRARRGRVRPLPSDPLPD